MTSVGKRRQFNLNIPITRSRKPWNIGRFLKFWWKRHYGHFSLAPFPGSHVFFTKNDSKWLPRHIGTSLDTRGVTEASLEALAPIERVDIFSHVGFTSQNEAILWKIVKKMLEALEATSGWRLLLHEGWKPYKSAFYGLWSLVRP